jgi:RNA-directed DNA polymerase
VSTPPPHLYRRRALELGRKAAVVDRVEEYEQRIRARGAYPVYTLNHLAKVSGASWIYLREIVARRRDPYLDISRPKRDGRTRPISSPEPILMDVQRWILHNVLYACDIDPASYAYQRERSIVDCAERHLGARWLVKLDLHDFFHRVREHTVYSVFRQLEYPKLLSFELARLCTRLGNVEPVRRDRAGNYEWPPYAVDLQGRLPQGAPTSGMLANVAMRSADAKLGALAQEKGLVYTRYSDDLTFSAGGDFCRRQAAEVVNRASQIVKGSGFTLHRAKTRVVPPGARHIVLGLLVADDRVHLLPGFKRRLEVHVRGAAKFGISEHATHRRFDSVLSMINHVDGCIAFAESVEPDFAVTARGAWNTALRKGGYAQAGS